MSKTPPAPKGIGTSGRALWKAAVTTFDLEPHELVVLEQACRVRDTLDALAAAVEKDGLMLQGSHGAKLHPAIAEARQQRLALARLLATLALPAEAAGMDLPASRGVRGVYRSAA